MTNKRGKNKADETKLQKDFDDANNAYTQALESYDSEMKLKQEEKADSQKKLDEVLHELQIYKDDWEKRKEEKRKYNEIQDIIKRKEEEQRKQREALDKAAQYIQAHWLGMLARRDAEKARRGKKKKKGKKKS